MLTVRNASLMKELIQCLYGKLCGTIVELVAYNSTINVSELGILVAELQDSVRYTSNISEKVTPSSFVTILTPLLYHEILVLNESNELKINQKGFIFRILHDQIIAFVIRQLNFETAKVMAAILRLGITDLSTLSLYFNRDILNDMLDILLEKEYIITRSPGVYMVNKQFIVSECSDYMSLYAVCTKIPFQTEYAGALLRFMFETKNQPEKKLRDNLNKFIENETVHLASIGFGTNCDEVENAEFAKILYFLTNNPTDQNEPYIITSGTSELNVNLSLIKKLAVSYTLNTVIKHKISSQAALIWEYCIQKSSDSVDDMQIHSETLLTMNQARSGMTQLLANGYANCVKDSTGSINAIQVSWEDSMVQCEADLLASSLKNLSSDRRDRTPILSKLLLLFLTF